MSTIDKSIKNHAVSPMPKFRFEVDFGTDLEAAIFQEVAGLDADAQVIDSENSNPVFAADKMPRGTRSNITFKRGVMASNSIIWSYFYGSELNVIKPVTIVIKLVSENNDIVKQWQLNNAWPTEISTTNLASEGNEIAVESVDIAFETMVIAAS